MTPEGPTLAIRGTLLDSIDSDVLTLNPETVPETVKVERPRNCGHDDWATSVAIQLTRRASLAPRTFAGVLTKASRLVEGIDSIEIAGLGFTSIRLGAASTGELTRTVMQVADSYGSNSSLAGTSINLEYVSANPAGPVYLSGARWAVVGDSPARLMAASGARVIREYYFNDHNSQIDRFAKSLCARTVGREVPEDGYGGQYTADITEKVRHDVLQAGEADPITLFEDEAVETFKARGAELMFGGIKKHLCDFRSEFDVFSRKDSLHESSTVTRTIDTPRERGEVFDEDDAVWPRTAPYGDDRDRVLIKSDGQVAYFAGDVVYYLDKRDHGANSAIYLLSADHRGHIGRTMAMRRTFGDTPGANMQIPIGQTVNLLENGAPMCMSKRVGTIVALDNLVDVVGIDAARYALVRVSMDSNLDIDLDPLASRMNENSVCYTQYVHVKTRNVARNAAEHGVNCDAGFGPAALSTPADAEFLGAFVGFPAQVVQATKLREPHYLTRYPEQFALACRTWYGQCRVTPRGDDPVEPGHVAHLWFNDAVTQVLHTGLGLLGVGTSERM